MNPLLAGVLLVQVLDAQLLPAVPSVIAAAPSSVLNQTSILATPIAVILSTTQPLSNLSTTSSVSAPATTPVVGTAAANLWPWWVGNPPSPTGAVSPVAPTRSPSRPRPWPFPFPPEHYIDYEAYFLQPPRKGKKGNDGWMVRPGKYKNPTTPCPAFCYDDDISSAKSAKKAASVQRTYGRRAENPEVEVTSSADNAADTAAENAPKGIFRAFHWPTKQTSNNNNVRVVAPEDDDNDLPVWLQDLKSKKKAKKRQVKAKRRCPAYCYRTSTLTSTSPLASPTGSSSGSEVGSVSGSGSSSSSSSSSSALSSSSTGSAFPSIPVSSAVPTSVEIPTTLQTTAVSTVVVTLESPAPPPPAFTPVSSGDTWTGNTLATVCPNTCYPFDPSKNFCDITTSCATTGGKNYYCACRAGYRANDWNPKDFSKQAKMPGQPYVYVAPGIKCETLCSDQICSEVPTRPVCA